MVRGLMCPSREPCTALFLCPGPVGPLPAVEAQPLHFYVI